MLVVLGASFTPGVDRTLVAVQASHRQARKRPLEAIAVPDVEKERERKALLSTSAAGIGRGFRKKRTGRYERFFSKLKQFRKVAARCDNRDGNVLASVQLASIPIRLRHNKSAAWKYPRCGQPV